MTYPVNPSWKLNTTFCRELCGYIKASTHPVVLQMRFITHLNEEHSDSNHIYTDESKTAEDTGCAAFAPLHTIKYRLNPNCSIYTAELYAVSSDLHIIENDNQNRNYTIISDS